MKITRQKNKTDDNLFDYEITDEGKKLQLKQNKEGDLYWLMDDPEPSDYSSFKITKENEYLYTLFTKLYIQIMRFQETGPGKYTKEELEAFNNSIAHYLLTRNGNITWYSDKDEYDECDVMSITKTEDEFILEFVHQTKDLMLYYKPGMFDICFKKENSRYQPFNKLFIEMFQELQKYNPEYHQIHLDELKYQKKKTK